MGDQSIDGISDDSYNCDTDSHISSDSESIVLSWDSSDSRPAGPSPPSSDSSMSQLSMEDDDESIDDIVHRSVSASSLNENSLDTTGSLLESSVMEENDYRSIDDDPVYRESVVGSDNENTTLDSSINGDVVSTTVSEMSSTSTIGTTTSTTATLAFNDHFNGFDSDETQFSSVTTQPRDNRSPSPSVSLANSLHSDNTNPVTNYGSSTHSNVSESWSTLPNTFQHHTTYPPTNYGSSTHSNVSESRSTSPTVPAPVTVPQEGEVIIIELQEVVDLAPTPPAEPTGTGNISNKRPAEPEPPCPNLNGSTLSEGEEGTLCTICMEPLTNTGNHRVVCLRCGHIFGQSCVERWIRIGCNNGAKRCPTCNKKACLKDIRVLFFPKVIPLDTSEKERLTVEKEQLSRQKAMTERELETCKLQQKMHIEMYEKRISKLEQQLRERTNFVEGMSQDKNLSPSSTEAEADSVTAQLLHSVSIAKDGGCRVLAFNHLRKELVVSQPSGNTVFAGFGVRILNTVDFTPTRFVFLHQKMIRDLCFHAEDRDLLLSVSLDNTAKLVDLSSTTTVHTFKGEAALWSCCWERSNPHLLLVGSQMGKVYQYDRRMMDDYVNLWENPGNLTPVVSLLSIPSDANTPYPQGGFISCRLNGAFSYARSGDVYITQELDMEGPFMSMKYEPSTQMLLTASRPTSRCPYARIKLNLVDATVKGTICLPEIHSFDCGSSARVMSRTAMLPVRDDSLVIAHHESGRTVNMWSAKSGNLVHRFPIKEPYIDFTALNLRPNQNMFAALSERKVNIYNVT